ncbi:hypothetical protein [Methanoculleus sp.]|jgi:hypothetical protein|uniref:hypothetical protein n=1 Tax=Methanoculleus sp. TaxID=90427 RepID=UPI001BD1DDFE|nr:hypothetical protein [Methanoculleus sp.]
MKNRNGVLSSLAVLILFTLGSTGAVSIDSDMPVIEKTSIEEISEAGIQAGIAYMNARDHVLQRYGVAPPFEDVTQWRAWDDRLDEFIDTARCDVKPYFHPEGPVHIFGHDVEGYVYIAFVDNRTPDSATMDEIYRMLESRGEEMGIDDLPVKFVSSPLVELDIALKSPPSVLPSMAGGLAGTDPFARAAMVRTILAS